MSLRMLCLGLLLCSSLSIGCATSQEGSGGFLKTFTWKLPDHREWVDESDDKHAYVGELARGDRPMEEDPDPWWQKYIMSEKARDIERNLGIE